MSVVWWLKDSSSAARLAALGWSSVTCIEVFAICCNSKSGLQPARL